MKGSFLLGTAFGIPIRLHWSFLLFGLWALSIGGSPFWILVLFLCVLLHELGHCLVARRHGVKVIDITFWPLGGMARMSAMPEDPRVEGPVAAAGPAVNFVLALVSTLFFLLFHALNLEFPKFLFASFFWINLALGTFNLVPAFPMDGGRILRAYLARRRDWVAATEKAVSTGRWFALGMALLPFVLPLFYPGLRGGFVTLPLIALFVWFAGGRELFEVRLRHGLSPFGGGPIPGASPEGFARPTVASVHETVETEPEDRFAASRPSVLDEDVDRAQRKKHGFDEADIRALERFRGRLRRAPGPREL